MTRSKNRIGRTAGAGRCADTGRANTGDAGGGRDPAQFPAYVEQLKRRGAGAGHQPEHLDRALRKYISSIG